MRFIRDRLVRPRVLMRVSLLVAQPSEVSLVPRVARAALTEPVRAASAFAVYACSAAIAICWAVHVGVTTSAA